MTIHQLPNDHLQLDCDLEGCSMTIIKHGITEEQLLDRAEELGWNIDREFGLHYCPMTTMHECSVCGAPTQMSIRDEIAITDEMSIRDVSTGETTYYCREHWPY